MTDGQLLEAQRAHDAKRELFDVVRLMGQAPPGATVEDVTWGDLTSRIKEGFALLCRSLQNERRSLIPKRAMEPCCHIQEAKEKEQAALRVQFPKADEVCRLIRYDFDGMENRYSDALYQEEIGVFGPGDGRTAHGKVGDYLREMLPVRPYLGWDGVVYPRFDVKRLYLR